MFARRLTRAARLLLQPVLRARLGLTELEGREVPAFFGGVQVAYGDVNGDRFPDVVAGQATGGSRISVIDGKTGAEAVSFSAYEPSFTGGVYVACGDTDGDGAAEIVTGTGNTGGPNVRVFDGKTGQVRFGFFPYEGSFRGGVIVAAADTTGDGKAEIITGTGVGGGPRVQVIDAATQGTIADFFALEDSFRGGVLVGAGDVTGDGKAELITGTGVGGGPRVQVIDAKTQALVSNFFAFEDSFRGGVLIGTADTDGDGKAEVLAGTGPGGGPVVAVFGGADARPGVRFSAYDPNFRGGVIVAGGDTTGDGKAEIITGAGPGGPSTVNVFAGDASATLLSFSVFDPVQLPAPNPLSAMLPASGGGGIDPTQFLPPVGLTADTTRVVAGKDDMLVFTVRADGPTPPSRVELFQADAAGKPGVLLAELLDDGEFATRDVAAKDGVFTNTFAVNFPAPGEKVYAAVATVGGQSVTFTTKVTAVPALTGAALQARLVEVGTFQTRFDTAISQGKSVADALADVRGALQASPATVRVETITTDTDAIFWQTTDGLSAFAGVRPPPSPPAPAQAVADDPVPPAVAFQTAEACKGKALSVAFRGAAGSLFATPFEAVLRSKGYEITPASSSDAGLSAFVGLQRFNVVFIDADTRSVRGPSGRETVIDLDSLPSLSQLETFGQDLQRGSILVSGAGLRIRPEFIARNSGQMKGAAVFVTGESAKTPDLANTFVNRLQASVYAGFTERFTGTSSSFVIDVMTAAARHLVVDGGTFGTTPGDGAIADSGDVRPRFRVFANPATANQKLVPCSELKNTVLDVVYSWSRDRRDLDTGTTYLGKTVGFSGDRPDTTFMKFTGDNTGSGGSEKVTVNLGDPFYATPPLWTGSVTVNLRAGWFIPAGGMGTASVTVSLRDKTTEMTRGTVTKSITPGMQRGLAMTDVGTVTITADGTPGQEGVSFTLTTR